MNCINFLPESVQQRRAAQRRRARTAIAALALATAAVAGWAPLSAWTKQLEVQEAALAERLRFNRQEQGRAEAADYERREAQRQLDLLDNLRDPIAPVDILALLSEITPEDVTFSSVELKASRPKPEPRDKPKAAPKPGVLKPEAYRFELTIDGYAPDDRAVVAFVAALDRHRLFSDVKVPANRNAVVEGLQARSFRVQLGIDLNRRLLADTEGVADAQR